MTEPANPSMNPARTGSCLMLAALLVFFIANVHAKGLFGRDDDDDENAKPVVEWEIKLPAFPKMDGLLPFTTGPVATQVFAIDPKSLEVGAEEIRYTLVATSQSGARSISYEGIRCKDFEMRRYAFGHADGTWRPAQSPKWMPIKFLAANRPQAVLAQDFFCDGVIVGGKEANILDRIRYDRSLQANKSN